MRTALTIVGGLLAVFGLAIGAVFYITAGMVDTADAFFEAVKRGDVATAHGFLSEDFRASTDQTALEGFLSKNALQRYQDASWSNRRFNNGRGDLEGSVTTETGGVVPLKLSFVKEHDEWRIYSIQKPTAGLQAETDSQGLPSATDQIVLVKESMRNFAISVDQKSMAHFRGTVSRLWQRQVTTEQLEEAFASVYGLDFSVLNDLEPTLEPPSSLGEDGELVLTGHYPTTPKRLRFEQSYVYEGVSWKLFGFSFETE